MSKLLATTNLGTVTISQIDADGQTLERWTLHNAFISKVNYGSLDYSSEDLTEMELELQYDWAMLETPGTEGASTTSGGKRNPGSKKYWADDGSTDPHTSTSS
jgi:hypothetical protein